MLQHGNKPDILIVTNFRKFSVEKDYCMDFVNLRQLTKVGTDMALKRSFTCPSLRKLLLGFVF